MARDRIVLGAIGDDAGVAQTARRLRDAGHEIVFVGGHQTPERLVRAAIAEDASRIVIDAGDATLERVVALCRDLGIGDVEVSAGCDVLNSHEPGVTG